MWGVPIITGVFFYLVGVVTTVYIKRPKLMVTGGGGGGSGAEDGFQTYPITVENVPGRVGIPIGQTVLLGFRINRGHWFGLPVMRETAMECVAHLCDRDGRAISGLWWRSPNDNSKRELVVNIEASQRLDLFLFAQKNNDLPNYFPYTPGPNDNPRVPPAKFSGKDDFVVQISYSNGQKVRKFRYTVFDDYQSGHIMVQQKGRGEDSVLPVPVARNIGIREPVPLTGGAGPG